MFETARVCRARRLVIPSEQAIDQAIDRLSPGELQRFVEAYSRIAFAGRFDQLVVHGRNSRDETVAGWPDAYAVMADGRIDVVEATRDARSWRRHLAADIERASALSAPGLGGFVFFAWARPPAPEPLRAERTALLAAGADATEIAFIFRHDLVAGVRSAACAALWRELGLAVSAWPFVELSKAPVFGDGGGRLFAPSREEIVGGGVHLPRAAEHVLAQLDRRGWALVLGRGGSGKTVLAVTLGMDWELRGAPCYYLDLASASVTTGAAGTTGALDVLATRGAPNTLFIVDNVHRDDEFAASIHSYWCKVGNGSRLLMLGRRSVRPPSALGLRSPMADLLPGMTHLRVDRDVLLGVWRRLEARNATSSANEPPPRVLGEWLDMFGGDLIGFSAALALRGTRPPGWTLEAGDARAYVSTRYLDPLSRDERRALLDVAAWSTIELSLPASVDSGAHLSHSIADGIVEPTDEGYAGYRIIHPGLAGLIVAARPEPPSSVFLDHAHSAPDPLALEAARRLNLRGDDELAETILRPRIVDAAALTRLLRAGGVRQIPTQASFLRNTLGDPCIAEAVRRTQGLGDELLHLDAETVLSLLTTARNVPGLAVAMQTGWSVLAQRAQTQLVERLAEHATLSITLVPLIFRKLRRGLPLAFADVVDEFARREGVETFFGTPRRLSQARWRDLLTAVDVSEPFRARLLRLLRGEDPPMWLLLNAPDSLVRVTQLRERNPDLGAAFLALVHRDDFQRLAFEKAFHAGPAPFLSLCRLGHAEDRRLLEVLREAPRDPRWEATLARWRKARAKYARLEQWAEENSLSLAAALREDGPAPGASPGAHG